MADEGSDISGNTMLFGEYLLQQGVVSTEQVLKAVAAQMKAQPSIFEIVAEAGFLTADQLIAVVWEQSRKSCGFVEAAKSLGIWTRDFEQRLRELMSKGNVSLVHFLVQQGSVSLDVLTRHLDSFLDEVKEVKVVKESKEAPPLAQEFLRATAAEKIQDLSNLLAFMGGWSDLDGPEVQDVINSASDALRGFRLAARASSFRHSEQIYAILEVVLRAIPGRKAEITPEKLQLWCGQIQQGFDLGILLRDRIEADGAEKVSADPSFTTRLNEGLLGLKRLFEEVTVSGRQSVREPVMFQSPSTRE